jgi:hypothetical protein
VKGFVITMWTPILIASALTILISGIGGISFIYYFGLRKWWIWFFALGTFLGGFFFGLSAAGIYPGLESGVIITVLMIAGGGMSHFYKQHYTNINQKR